MYEGCSIIWEHKKCVFLQGCRHTSQTSSFWAVEVVWATTKHQRNYFVEEFSGWCAMVRIITINIWGEKTCCKYVVRRRLLLNVHLQLKLYTVSDHTGWCRSVDLMNEPGSHHITRPGSHSAALVQAGESAPPLKAGRMHEWDIEKHLEIMQRSACFRCYPW